MLCGASLYASPVYDSDLKLCIIFDCNKPDLGTDTDSSLGNNQLNSELLCGFTYVGLIEHSVQLKTAWS